MERNEPPVEPEDYWESLYGDRGVDDEPQEIGEPEEIHAWDDDLYDPSAIVPRQAGLPWYRTSSAVIAAGAIGVAAIAILVSAVLLVSQGSTRRDDHPSDAVAPSAATSAPLPTPTMTIPPPPPPVTTSEPPSTASVIVQAPAPRRTRTPANSAAPTPITRAPISVHPTPHPAFPHN